MPDYANINYTGLCTEEYECGEGLLKGKPPPRFQCIAIRQNGMRCRKWRNKGSDTCEFHVGQDVQSFTKRVGSLPRIYKHALRESLRDTLGELMGEDPREALNLFEELGLMRLTAANAVKLFDAAHDVEDPKQRLELMSQTSTIMSACLKEVQSMCESAARIENQGKDKYSIHSLKIIIDQIVLISHDLFKQHPDLVLAFQQAINERVSMPNENNGTTITPDQDVLAMDATIPKE